MSARREKTPGLRNRRGFQNLCWSPVWGQALERGAGIAVVEEVNHASDSIVKD